jgi:hypothetical protein
MVPRYSYRGVPDSKAHVVKQPGMQAELPLPLFFVVAARKWWCDGCAIVCCLLVSCQTREDQMVRDIQDASVGRSGRVQVGQLQTLARHERENSEEAALLTEPHIVADKTSLKALLQPATHVPTLRNFRLSFILISSQPIPRIKAPSSSLAHPYLLSTWPLSAFVLWP